MSSVINLIHILFLVPLFFYVYYKGTNKDDKIQPWLCYFLMGLAVVSFIYHCYKLYLLSFAQPSEAMLSQGQDEKWKDWIYVIHVLIILPLIFYIGYNCQDTARKYFELLLVVTFAALGYHSFNLIKYGF